MRQFSLKANQLFSNYITTQPVAQYTDDNSKFIYLLIYLHLHFMKWAFGWIGCYYTLINTPDFVSFYFKVFHISFNNYFSKLRFSVKSQLIKKRTISRGNKEDEKLKNCDSSETSYFQLFESRAHEVSALFPSWKWKCSQFYALAILIIKLILNSAALPCFQV